MSSDALDPQQLSGRDLFITDAISIPRRELQFQFSRSSGPGGQNVNKVNSKVQLSWNIELSSALPESVKTRFVRRFANRINAAGELLLSSQRFRDQSRNRADCLHRLRGLVGEVLQPERVRRPTKPSRSSVKRRLDNKRRRSSLKQQRRKPTRDD